MGWWRAGVDKRERESCLQKHQRVQSSLAGRLILRQPARLPAPPASRLAFRSTQKCVCVSLFGSPMNLPGMGIRSLRGKGFQPVTS